MAQEQRLIRYYGSVQGVGFRFTAYRLAERYDVTGYVRNCPDGSVEVMVEGEAREIGAFLNELAASFEGYIRSQEQEARPFQGSYSGFTIRR